MNRMRLFTITLLPLLFLGISLHALVRVNVYDIRNAIRRDQIFNYELSSRAFRKRFQEMLLQSEGIEGEANLNVLESGIMNFQAAPAPNPDLLERIGVLFLNAVRFITFKSPVHHDLDGEKFTRLQYAFYLERIKNLREAANHYRDLDGPFRGSPMEHGFVLLHHAFCLALLGEFDPALARLDSVQRLYPTASVARDAAILAAIIASLRSEQNRIMREIADPGRRGAALFESGNYPAAVRAFETARTMTAEQKLMLYRSLENTGRKEEAVSGYLEILSNGDAPPLAYREANRRLLVVGTFYEGGADLARLAQENARRTGDAGSVASVNRTAELVRKSVVIEQLQESISDDERGRGAQTQAAAGNETPDPLAALRERLAREYRDSVRRSREKMDQKRTRSAALIEKNRIAMEAKIAAAEKPPARHSAFQNAAATRRSQAVPGTEFAAYLESLPEPPPVEVRLSDGRVLDGDHIAIEGHLIVLSTGDRRTRLPLVFVESIAAGVGRAGFRVKTNGAEFADVRFARFDLESWNLELSDGVRSIPADELREFSSLSQ